MKRKIIGITLMLILISSSLSLCVEAGSEKNPELEDETGEVLSYVDIVSVWFFEKPDEPEYIYVNMKLANYKFFRISQGFHVYFKINSKSYQVSFLKDFFLKSSYGLRFYNNSHLEYHKIYGQVKKIDNIISWKIPKDMIGSPEVGDHITRIDTYSGDGLYASRLIIPLIIMQKFNISWYDLHVSKIPILKKISNYLDHVIDYSTDDTSEGKDYIIQY